MPCLSVHVLDASLKGYVHYCKSRDAIYWNASYTALNCSHSIALYQTPSLLSVRVGLILHPQLNHSRVLNDKRAY